MEVINRDTSTLPIQGPSQSARQLQASFVYPAQMAMFARVTSYPPLGQITCLQTAKKASRLEEDAVSPPNMVISDIARLSEMIEGVMQRNTKIVNSYVSRSLSSPAAHSPNNHGKHRSGITSLAPNGNICHCKDVTQIMLIFCPETMKSTTIIAMYSQKR